MNPTTAEPHTADADGGSPSERPHRGPGYYLFRGLKVLASLQLTVVLFGLGILLVFFGTMAQVDFGIWTVVEQYFWSWVVWVPFDLFNKFGQVFMAEHFVKGSQWDGHFPLPGGKLLGGAMLVNLLAAHLIRFRVSWKRSGILLIHSGLILLFIGEFVTREYALEERMSINEGAACNFAEDTRVVELAFVDKSDPAVDQGVVIPESMLRHAKGRITNPDLPVDVEVLEYMINSALESPAPGKPNRATAGFGLAKVAVEKPQVSGVDPNQKIDVPAAYVKLFKKGTNEELGTFLVSLRLYLMDHADSVEVGGKKYDLTLRFKRYYKPYSLYLEKFRFDRYPGTNKAKNYSSEVTLTDPEEGIERKVTIRMNEPLRHRGETFYQSSFNETETGTVLQVVQNPGWLIPYISCVVVTVGMLLHFGIYLTQFLLRRASA